MESFADGLNSKEYKELFSKMLMIAANMLQLLISKRKPFPTEPLTMAVLYRSIK
jgi:hypothetical protein